MLSSCEEVECSHATGNDGPKRSYQPEPGWCGHFPPEPRPFGIQLDTFIIWHSRRCRHPLSAHECRRRRDVAPNYRHTTHRADDVFRPPRPVTFCLASQNPGADITIVARGLFGEFAGQVVTVLYF